MSDVRKNHETSCRQAQQPQQDDIEDLLRLDRDGVNVIWPEGLNAKKAAKTSKDEAQIVTKKRKAEAADMPRGPEKSQIRTSYEDVPAYTIEASSSGFGGRNRAWNAAAEGDSFAEPSNGRLSNEDELDTLKDLIELHHSNERVVWPAGLNANNACTRIRQLESMIKFDQASYAYECDYYERGGEDNRAEIHRSIFDGDGSLRIPIAGYDPAADLADTLDEEGGAVESNLVSDTGGAPPQRWPSEGSNTGGAPPQRWPGTAMSSRRNRRSFGAPGNRANFDKDVDKGDCEDNPGDNPDDNPDEDPEPADDPDENPDEDPDAGKNGAAVD